MPFTATKAQQMMTVYLFLLMIKEFHSEPVLENDWSGQIAVMPAAAVTSCGGLGD